MVILSGKFKVTSITPALNTNERAYIEADICPEISYSVFQKLRKRYIVVLRDYNERFFYDNLFDLKFVPVGKSLSRTIDPFSVMFSKPSGECILAVRASQASIIESLDTADIRNLSEGKSSLGSKIVVFAKHGQINGEQMLEDITRLTSS